MFPIWHVSAVYALDNYSPDFIFGCAAPDIISVTKELAFKDTHDRATLKEILPLIKNDDFALGFATHGLAYDLVSHGFNTAEELDNLESWKKGYCFEYLYRTFPQIRHLGHARQERLHTFAEYALEMWIIKTRPELVDLAERMYEINVSKIAASLAHALHRDSLVVEATMRHWLKLNKALTAVSRTLAPFASDSVGHRQKCLEDCMRATKSIRIDKL